ncbi:MAG: macrolide ABC transporter permease/ATP-binding protein MacB [Candidatus Dactylopiibacterium carminicum]|uniref:Pyoverdine export ATP-binding/permease protein PvdT n=1 Tax=Candidatus Dactylopiibacterium carminicum TaxID=857335 RepID=A0A272EZ03_9RHOO|nr:MacB family efflux pump subunit [Candidatus Dactylopiibacterium carminicum]KAF7600853.1 MacB family efflux pump subunit [Candidatus Dactylopiibacterium carminicum]PAS95352.1 MAG: macrolide ABC transporter permease/ATP-binding protein MacB [Candidatus Dactylopiibacterium carminicum]PAS98637.1 MAG: macrolide ABC transporter permease/ATP-binding protein MacB [Candidatus Dactylopiibacterium carminicum]PAT00856.1 MAG: macrolide ABC transporter permease/ATP-binding protein MacB [Candidatus Dactylo
MSIPLLQLRDLCRDYPAGEDRLRVLDHVNLDIHAGEMVAIVGASGSGKSTLMNILGCLDRPSEGSYRVGGRETGALEPDELAQLRREHFGFIFQRYHLLADLDAQGNVEIPAIYAGRDHRERHARARQLLERLGLSDRLHHKPGQLSGGQQQRVSIARALMNGGQVILADEPTGALDSHSGQEVMAVLKALHAEGHTIILVTHDMEVARHAQRIIEIRDGLIIADRGQVPAREIAGKSVAQAPTRSWLALRDRLGEALRMALVAMVAHRMRTFLTMLGIIIGIASVVSVVALGQGTRARILKDISAMGTNTIDIYPGAGFGDMRSGGVRTLVSADAEALAGQSWVDSVTPSVSSSKTLRYRNVSVTGNVNGVGAQYFRVRGLEFAEGHSFDADSEQRLAQEVVIDQNTREKLFGKQAGVIGEVILLGTLPARVIGVTKKRDSGFGNNDSLNVWLPYTTVQSRILGQYYLGSITVRVRDDVSSAAAEQGINKLMQLRHAGRQDFFLFNSDTIRQTIEKTTAAMAMLISAIAVISLVVGGIGVMNIMLVSVTERTREIGVRMAVGARQGDIMQQFLIEAVLVCLAGGVLGVLTARAIGFIVTELYPDFQMIYSTSAILAAFACSTLIGLVFGFMPARNAARLDPVDALARE